MPADRFAEVIEAREQRGATLAAIVEGGWTLTFYCAGCQRPRATFTSEGLLARFGKGVRATIGQVCDRMRCDACGGRGGWVNCTAGANASAEEDGKARELTLWQARDLRLRRLLAKFNLPLEIADERWMAVEAALGGYHQWKPRCGPTALSPLASGR